MSEAVIEATQQQSQVDTTDFKDEKQFVVFILGRETYGLDISQVREIITMQELTSVPRTAAYIKGVINLRGRVIPVFDLAGKLGLVAQEDTKSTRIMVVEVNGVTVGMIVDGVSEVLRISPHVVEAPSGLLATDVSEHYIKGIAKCNDRLVIILNLDSILTGADLSLAI